MAVRSRHRPRDSRPAADRDEDLLRLQHRVRRAAEHARLPGLPRAARRAAGAQPRARSIYAITAALALGCEVQRDVDLRAQELLLSGPAEGLSDLAVRAAARARRRRSTSPSTATRRTCGSRASTWKRTPASRCTKASPIPIADLRRLQPQRRAAHRDRHASPTCGRPRRPRSSSAACAQILVWLGVNDGNMEEGSLRCDANVSVRPAGADDARHQGRGEEPQLVPLSAEGARVRDRAADRRARATAAASCRRRGCGTRRTGATLLDAQQGRSARLPLLSRARSAAARRRRGAHRSAIARDAAGAAGGAAPPLRRAVRAARVRRRRADAVARRWPTTSKQTARPSRQRRRRRATGSWASCCAR